MPQTASVTYIGKIITPYQNTDQCPGQARPENGTCQIVVNEEFAPAIQGLKIGGHIQVLYWFNQADRTALQRIPKWSKNNEMRGVFSIRSPMRPNPIALSTVEIFAIDENILTVTSMDCIDGTPLLDIKPYINQLEK
ncbi:MAG: tRNA (N6-threonylcarbamoyladenosine(37)-N6)-methyltransferase TrmO [Rhodospirillaceae bacterium]|jgi:tRNA (adenine37-N6)-methyltransferase|nr:tRNA (N6-threonylcarbamoyladenosine(37)-N6)-methyltransferase TrmO [Rhodospirillaceae bacterium]MBT7954323.1 tRNA (N6-threonylcarbamoyladenosine(37)-N6)-methyltransferase TrmO [Rhodospirillaceae bacterium]